MKKSLSCYQVIVLLIFYKYFRCDLFHKDFIAHTGIADVRGVDIEEDAKKTSKQKSRERMQPKVGRIDIDYQVLHDAFFRYQTKPDLSILGDLCVRTSDLALRLIFTLCRYFEGKEFEVKLKSKIPGQLSSELKVRYIVFLFSNVSEKVRRTHWVWSKAFHLLGC